VATRVQGLLVESTQWTGGKQRLTATRLHELLRAEGHQVSVTVVKDAVAEWKRRPPAGTDGQPSSRYPQLAVRVARLGVSVPKKRRAGEECRRLCVELT